MCHAVNADVTVVITDAIADEAAWKNYYEHGNVYVILKFTITYFIVLMYVRYGVLFV